ncbi:accessory gene regulator B family protein [Clostridium felsineum]|uniref:accessory gene regulator B family protein n=1 Tax=Clostridium felsineum TaxID=36839 RepID=UPI00098C6E85|nr:Accessory gene regulator protein B [Clostridium felsineum DSM 794]
MYRLLAFKIAKCIANKENTDHFIRHGYYYVLLLLISTIGEIALILLLSLLLCCFKYTVVVLVTFIILRLRFNTYHCRKMKTCTIFSLFFIILLSFISKFISTYNINFIVSGSCTTLLFILLINQNKVQGILKEMEGFF